MLMGIETGGEALALGSDSQGSHLHYLSLTLGIQVYTVDAPLQLLQALMHLQGTHAVALVQFSLDSADKLCLQ